MRSCLEAKVLATKANHRRWTLNERKVCVECRHASDAMPDSCPSCKATTFVFIGSNQNADSVCDELLMVAALNRIGLQKSPPANAPRKQKLPRRRQETLAGGEPVSAGILRGSVESLTGQTVSYGNANT